MLRDTVPMHESSASALRLLSRAGMPAAEQRRIHTRENPARFRILAGLCFAAITIGHCGEALHVAMSAAEPGFVSLFNGRTLEGWTVKCLPKDKDLAAKAWSVDQGTILANTTGHTEHFYIIGLQIHSGHELKLRFKDIQIKLL